MPSAWNAARLKMGSQGIWRACCSSAQKASRVTLETRECSEYYNLINCHFRISITCQSVIDLPELPSSQTQTRIDRHPRTMQNRKDHLPYGFSGRNRAGWTEHFHLLIAKAETHEG